jgi:predicted metal-dependent hydrolase
LEKERAELIELTGRSDPFWASCRLRRSRKARRVIARVLAGGEIELVLPIRHSEKEAFDFLRDKGVWVEKQLARSLAPVTFLEHLRSRPRFSIDGKKRTVALEFGGGRVALPSWRRTETAGVAFTLHPARDPEKQAIHLARSLAKTYLPVRVATLGESFGLQPKQVRVGDQRSRWGSCSSRGALSLNWRLLLLEPKLQDYVIHHELAHIKIMDHSSNYWNFLAKLNPKSTRLDRELTKISRELMNVGRLAIR